jgi:5-methylcytosine-specific restriction protein A
MPVAAPRWCPRCLSPHPSGVACPVGAAERRAEADRHRPSARRRLYTREWERRRAAFLRDHPWCACGQRATEVHHTVDHHGDPGLFWREELWEARCKPCHSGETMRRLNARKRAPAGVVQAKSQ